MYFLKNNFLNYFFKHYLSYQDNTFIEHGLFIDNIFNLFTYLNRNYFYNAFFNKKNKL